MLKLSFTVALAIAVTLPVVAEAATFNILYNFTSATDAYGTFALAKDGTMYTTALTAGTEGDGALIKFDPATKVATILYSFHGGSDGAQPVPGIVLAKNGMIYGATAAGGATNEGTVFAFDTKTATEKVLTSFTGTNGQTPQYGPVLGIDGDLYGTTSLGGTSDVGVAYKIMPSSGKETTLLTFEGVNGSHPNALAVGASGLLYGTTNGGGSFMYYGVLFSIDPETARQTILYNFNENEEAAFPVYGLAFGANGLIYGTGGGDAFSFNPTTETISNLHAYEGGCAATATLVLDVSGNIYGTCGGPKLGGFGQVFAVNANTGVVTDLYTFYLKNSDPWHGLYPEGVSFGKNGYLYGTTLAGGSTWKTNRPGYGTIYKLTP